MSDIDLRKLMGLLDDPDDRLAASVMIKLLEYSGELMPLLGEMQEADDPLLRKRVQQLEVILNLRDFRKQCGEQLREDWPDVIIGMIQLHMLWFDWDDSQHVIRQVWDFLESAASRDIRNIADLGKFMAENSFVLPPESEAMEPENFCVGAVLDDKIGSSAILCALAMLAGLRAGLGLGLLRVNGEFCIISDKQELLVPENNWIVQEPGESDYVREWKNFGSLLRYAALMLFLFACSFDNFRNVHILGHVLTGGSGDKVLDFLPYPYNGCRNKDKSNEKIEQPQI